MAFMVPVVQNNWDLYGTGSGQSSRRSSQQSRRTSQSSGGLSRQTSACSGGSGGSAATSPGFSMQGQCFSSSRHAPGSGRRVSGAGSSTSGDSSCAPRSVTFGPPAPPSKAAGRHAEKHGFHTKVVDKLMRVLHRGEKEGARRS